MLKLLTSISILMLFSCQEQPYKNIYTPPLIPNPIENNFHINQETNELTKRIENIDNFKIQESSESLVRFQAINEIASEKISDYIDCGTMNNEVYANYINRIFDSSLKIKTILEIQPIDIFSSKISLVSSYVFTSIETGTKWAFKTNEPKMILVGTPAYGAEPYRKCTSRNFLESQIIEELLK
jgi:hypothetical protein